MVSSKQAEMRYQPGHEVFSAIVVRMVTLESSQRVSEHADGVIVHEPGYVVSPSLGESTNESPTWYPRKLADCRSLKTGHLNTLRRKTGRELNFETVTPEMVQAMIALKKSIRLDDKTTLVSVTLTNGFVIHETASCVDPRRYDQAVGESICMEKIEKKVWELLGFLLQTAKFGFAYVPKAEASADVPFDDGQAPVNGCSMENCCSAEPATER